MKKKKREGETAEIASLRNAGGAGRGAALGGGRDVFAKTENNYKQSGSGGKGNHGVMRKGPIRGGGMGGQHDRSSKREAKFGMSIFSSSRPLGKKNKASHAKATRCLKRENIGGGMPPAMVLRSAEKSKNPTTRPVAAWGVPKPGVNGHLAAGKNNGKLDGATTNPVPLTIIGQIGVGVLGGKGS